MRLPREWKNWQVFLVSVVLALLSMPLLDDYFFSIFPSRGSTIFGGGPEDLIADINTFLFLYLFFVVFLYVFLIKRFVLRHLVYLIIIPIILFMVRIDIFLGGIIVIFVGVALGKLGRNFKEK